MAKVNHTPGTSANSALHWTIVKSPKPRKPSAKDPARSAPPPNPASKAKPASVLESLMAEGVEHRKQLPRADLAHWDPKLRRRTPTELLDDSYTGRLPELAALKRQRMSVSPFGFFRGAVPVMAYDLSLAPNTGIEVQLCGDAHVQNLGAFCGIADALIFDINDFDETLRGPFEFDVKRMAASIFLAASAAPKKSSQIKHPAALRAVAVFLDAYSAMIHRFAAMPILEVARFQVHRLADIQPISKILLQAEHQSPARSLELLTEVKAGRHTFKTIPSPPPAKSASPVLRPATPEESDQVLAAFPAYVQTLLPERRHFFAQYRPVAVGFKIVGTGSVGLRDFCVYLDGNGPADPLFLQIKQEAPSAWAPYAWAPYLPEFAAAAPPHNGERAALGQRAMQFQSDPLLGWTTIDGRDFLVRQLNDHKAGLDVTTLKAAGLEAYAEVCGEILARGHARSGDARVLAGYLGKGNRFKEAITAFAHAYATQTQADWKEYTSRS